MYYSVTIKDRIHWLGVNDRRKHLFENIWPLPQGVSYNSYLITDERSALVDTVEMGSDGEYLERIESLLEGKPLDYLIVNHMEPDHSGEIDTIVRRWPAVKVIGNARTTKILTSYYPAVVSNIQEVCDGEELDLGYHKLRFVFTPWVHWPETMMTYDQTDRVLFSADAFGTFGTLDGGVFDDETQFSFYEDEMRRYYSNIVGKYSGMVQKAFAKLSGYPIDVICSLHGPVWRTNTARVVELYDRWSRYEAEEGVVVIYASMYNNTARLADYIAHIVASQGIKSVRVHDVSKTHISYLINDIWKYKGVLLGSCAYNTEMFPPMETLCRELLHMGVKNRYLGLFGSYSWNGGGVRNLQKFAGEIGWEEVCPAVEIQGRPDAAKYAACEKLGIAMAERLKADRA